MTFPPMRPQLELQRVHDMLNFVLTEPGLAEVVIPPRMLKPMIMAADCLCWALHHDVDSHEASNATNFGNYIDALRARLESLGCGPSYPPGEEYIIEE